MSRVSQMNRGVRADRRKTLLAALPVTTCGASSAAEVLIRINDVPEGTHAASIGHDHTNFIGLPTEQWGVSNNARPILRAPRFDEASFKVAADAKDVVIDIEVAK